MRHHYLAGVLAGGVALGSGSALATPLQFITNGSFETGNLSGWSVGGPLVMGNCPSQGRNWNVSASGSATGCSSVANPVDGRYAAYVMNDGFAWTSYTLSQNFLVPDDVSVDTAILSWMDSSVSGYSGTPRVFSVDFLLGTTRLDNVFSYKVPFIDGNAAWEIRSFDVSAILSAHTGETLTLRYTNYIPENWRGAGGFGLDGVSLMADLAPLAKLAPPSAISEPASLGLLGVGLLALAQFRRRSPATTD
ncbi:PEP-CTERM sorting domain-containing protein [Thiobacillus sp.]